MYSTNWNTCERALDHFPFLGFRFPCSSRHRPSRSNRPYLKVDWFLYNASIHSFTTIGESTMALISYSREESLERNTCISAIHLRVKPRLSIHIAITHDGHLIVDRHEFDVTITPLLREIQRTRLICKLTMKIQHRRRITVTFSCIPKYFEKLLGSVVVVA